MFLYFQISAKQNCYGFTRGDDLELLPVFPGNSGNRGNPTRGDLSARGDLPFRVSEKGGKSRSDFPPFIVVSEVREYDSSKLIVVSEVREYDSSKLIVKVKVK